MNENTGANAEIRELIARYREVIEGLQKKLSDYENFEKKRGETAALKSEPFYDGLNDEETLKAVIEFSNKHGVSPKEAYCALFGEKRAREAAEKSERKNSKIHALSQGGNAADDFVDIPLNSDELWAAKKAGISPADYLKFKKRGNE